MSIVVDANLVAALALPLPYAERAAEEMMAWKRGGVELCAPMLLEYELASILRKAVTANLMSTDDALQAMERILALNIRCIPPTGQLHERALAWAERLGQSKAYDAHYVALAEVLGAEMWTADGRLARNARQVGVDWVRLVSASVEST
ncbi:MAG: type II toxin-antitoxin system VapC family toxin [Anaerolineae bacterium]|jgi:predicted nucleic acid-binding protein